jgi:putative phosphoribosyl transferase
MSQGAIFRDRRDAGRKLARVLRNVEGWQEEQKDQPGSRAHTQEAQALVLAIPRGGVEVGAEVAQELGIPLDLWLAHKIGAPGNPEYAIGSVSINGERYLDRAAIDLLGIAGPWLEEETRRQSSELTRRMRLFRGHTEPVAVQGKTVILVDDGIATGATALAALASLRRAGARRLILAVPVAPHESVPQMKAAADEVVILAAPFGFASVGQFYENFEQVSDEEVIRILAAER